MTCLRPRSDHDLLKPEAQEAHLDEAAAPPGPDAANLWHFGTPCTSFCSWNTLNGGSRTSAAPEGTGESEVEKTGNALAALTCRCCATLHQNGREFLFEASAPDGRYPKSWDLPCVQKMRKTTGARIVPMCMYEWGAGPSG